MNLHTRLLLCISAAFMAVLGIGMSFLPQELLAYFDARSARPTIVLVQVTGALYLGFAMLNWMSRGVIVGGIYARPLALANFLHFAVVATTLVKLLMAQMSQPALLVTAIYVAFAVWFGLVLFTHPIRESS